MKKLKFAFFALLLLACTSSAIYLPMRYHAVTFRSQLHFVQKDNLGWDNTRLDLDKHPLKWHVVLQSPSLRAYFMKHHKDQFLSQLKKQSSSFWDRLKQKSQKAFTQLKQKVKTTVTEQTIRQIKDKTKKKLQELKQKGTNIVEQKK